MLQNQRFVDPEIAKNIIELQKEMKSLLAQKLQIQYNTQFMQPKRREELLRSNEQQRAQLRKIIEKSKLSMVEYFDKQVQVVSIDCVKKGSVVSKIVEQSLSVDAITRDPYDEIDQQTSESEITKSKSHSLRSKNTQSTNHNSHIYHHQQNDEQSLTLTGFQSQDHPNSILIDPHQPKLRKSCMSTHCRTNSRGDKFTQNNRQKGLLSEVLDGSLIQKKYNSSQIMQINEFNVTSSSPIHPSINCQPQSYLSYPHAKSTLLSYLQQQPQEDISQLYNKKIFWLEKKCHQLQQKNQQMLQVIHYQEKTIQDLQTFINQKDFQIAQLQNLGRQKNQHYERRISQLQYDFREVLQMIEKNKQKITLNLQVNQIISKYRSDHLNLTHHLPLTFKTFTDQDPRISSFYFSSQIPQEHSLVSISNVQPQQLSSSQIQIEKNEIIYLSRQLIELQGKLKQIQDENEQLKGQRKLLLKKVKI